MFEVVVVVGDDGVAVPDFNDPDEDDGGVIMNAFNTSILILFSSDFTSSTYTKQ